MSERRVELRHSHTDRLTYVIVGLELRIERIEAKQKLSQNRSEEDIYGTIAGLSEGSVRDHAVADDMTAVGLTKRRRDATHS